MERDKRSSTYQKNRTRHTTNIFVKSSSTYRNCVLLKSGCTKKKIVFKSSLTYLKTLFHHCIVTQLMPHVVLRRFSETRAMRQRTFRTSRVPTADFILSVLSTRLCGRRCRKHLCRPQRTELHSDMSWLVRCGGRRILSDKDWDGNMVADEQAKEEQRRTVNHHNR